MRQRIVNTKFFASESLAECSHAARLCFIGLWCCADDKGHLKFAPRSLKNSIFGLDDMPIEEFLELMVELEEEGCIRLYVVGADVFVDIKNFNTYQTISHPSKTNIPEPISGTPVALHEYSMSTPPKELIKELVNKTESGGSADAPPASSGESWDEIYSKLKVI